MNIQQPIYVPANVELEQQVLGAVLSNNDRFHEVSAILNADHFYDPIHAKIWETIAARVEGEKIASPVTLRSDFEGDEGLGELGGADYLVKLVGFAISTFAVKDYAREVIQIAEERRVYETFRHGMEAIRSRKPLGEVKSHVDEVLSGVSTDGKDSSISLLKAFSDTIAKIDEAYHGDKPTGIQTNLTALDERLGGLFSPDLIVLAGRPSMGKTSLATSLAIRAARQNVPVGIVSVEMDAEGLSHRILSELSGVEYFNYRRAHEMSEEDFRKTVDAAKENISLPIEIVPPHVRDIRGIFSALKKIDRQFANMGGLGLVVVDYMQLAEGKGNSLNERVGDVSNSLKNIAKTLECPVIALSQLSRQVENREDKRPMLSDLRDSGQIEQDADVVLFCYRESYYLSRERAKEDLEERDAQLRAIEQSKNVMEVITAKQRMGAIGSDRIGCAISTNQFWDLQAPANQEELEF
ncbi:DnaB-like helicase C-terminal domain-containing protein [Aliisedimentitalea scapharcae]|uniref:DNA 5'-3' helicase n=1 Tax=Aliisedimentitalea scapharcae TaxID=1524259 RepID=A0ABZ2XUQ2_9RHOB